jgi:hypothetical protein
LRSLEVRPKMKEQDVEKRRLLKWYNLIN